MKRFTKVCIFIIFLFQIGLMSFGQFVGDTVLSQATIQEVRKGSATQYSVSLDHLEGEQYTWGIVGGTPNPAPNSGAGTLADPYIINFTPNLHTISVTWSADDQTIAGLQGIVKVQKRAKNGCASIIQKVNVNRWSAATVSILDADYILCSGDPTTGSITVAFTGSPLFDFKYTIKSLDGTTSAEQIVTGITGATTTIQLPSHLINLSTTTDQTYIITITQMNDAFTGDGVIIDGTFAITVHPSINTGIIQASSSALQRR